jgi:antitoxin component YwqK of YwqJK toxin-antitoxin module
MTLGLQSLSSYASILALPSGIFSSGIAHPFTSKTRNDMSRKSCTEKFTIGLVLCLSALALQGCGNKVDCNGNKIKESAIEIIQSHLNDAVWYKDMHAALSGTPELTSVKTLSHNEELKQGQCSAKYTFTYNGKQREIDVAYDLAYLQDKGETEVKVAVNDVKGGIMAIAMVERPIKNGVEKIVDPKTGNLDHTIEWKNGIQDGVNKFYNPANNKLVAQVNVVNNQKNGSEKRWSADGAVLLTDLNWADGKATGFEKMVDANGKLLTNLIWKDGKATGFQTTGDPKFAYDEYNFKDGQYDGVHKKYYTEVNYGDGKVHVSHIENYKEGKLNGLAQDFSPAGKITQE